MIKTSIILFVLFYLVSANSQQTIDKLNSNQLKLPKETISKALSIDATGQVKSSATSDTELGYLSGASSNIQDQIDGKANDADAVHLTGDESIAGVKTLTGKLVTSSTVNASIPCPVMTQTQRDAIVSPSVGDCVFNSDTSLSNIYDGAIWKAMGGSGGGIGLWVTANGYAVDDVVIESNNIYICLTAHTSGTFATDLASLYWLRLSTDVTGATGLLPLATGGTNKNITASSGSIVYSDADSLELLAPGTSGQILQTNGASAPTFVNKSISGKAQNKTAVTSEEIQFPNNLLTETGTNKYLSESGNKNILDNPSFEHSTFSTSWTNSVGTFTQEASVLIDGKASAKLVLSAQAMSLTQSSTLYAAQFADGVQGLAMVRIKSDVAVKVCSIQAGTVSTSNCVTTNTDSKWGLYKVPFILGATSNGISISTNGTLVTGTVIVDDAFVGAVDLQSDIPASEMYGKVSMASDCTWSRTSAGTFADFATDATCTQTTSGKITSVSGQPAIVLPAGSPAGDYHVSMTGSFGPTHGSTTATTECEFRLTDGATGYSLGTITNVSNNSTVISARVPSLAGTITLNSPLTSATTYTVQGRTTQGSNVNESCRINNGNAIAVQTNFSVMYFPKNPVSIYTSNNADTDWASCGHTTSDFTGFGTVSAIETQCKRDGGDLLMKGKFTAGTPTAVEARVNLKLSNVALTSAGVSKIPSIQLAGDAVQNVSASSYFRESSLIEPSVTYITFGHQTSSTNALTKALGNGLVNASGVFSFTARIPINGWENSNIIIGSFNGLQSCVDTKSCTDTFSTYVSAAGAVSNENVDFVNGPCVLTNGVTTTCNFNAGVFSVTPNCTLGKSGGSGEMFISSISSTSIAISFANSAGSGGAKTDTMFSCQKSGADYIGKTAMAVASDQNLRTPGVTHGVVYSGSVGAAGGAVSSEVGDLINGSCSGTTTKTCTLNAGAIDSGNCVCTVSGAFGECRIGVTSSTITVLTANSAGAPADIAVQYLCHGVSP